MKLSEVTDFDARRCAQLLNFLKIAKAEGLQSADCIAVAEAMAWFNDVVKQIAMSLQAKKPPQPAAVEISKLPPTVILPVKKKKLGKKK